MRCALGSTRSRRHRAGVSLAHPGVLLHNPAKMSRDPCFVAQSTYECVLCCAEVIASHVFLQSADPQSARTEPFRATVSCGGYQFYSPRNVTSITDRVTLLRRTEEKRGGRRVTSRLSADVAYAASLDNKTRVMCACATSLNK